MLRLMASSPDSDPRSAALPLEPRTVAAGASVRPALGDHSVPDKCPGALRPFSAADGLIARVRLAGSPLTVAQARGIGALSAQVGDGQVHLTSRANVQVRGLDEDGARQFADAVAELGLLPSSTHERARNVVVAALADEDVLAVARALDRSICSRPALAGLSGRFLVGVDDGDGRLLALPLDVSLQVHGDVVRMALGTDPRGYEAGHTSDPDQVAAAVADAAADILELTREEGCWNVDDLSDDALDELHARVEGRLPATGSLRVVRTQPTFLGDMTSDDGRRFVAATAPLGAATGPGWDALADIAEAARGQIRVTPWHAVVVEGVAADALPAALARLAATGWAVSEESAWSDLGGCTGTPGCARSLSDVQSHARDLAADGPLGQPVMIVGCERRCGHPSVPHLVLVATGPDTYAVSEADGTHGPQPAPFATATTADLGRVIAEHAQHATDREQTR